MSYNLQPYAVSLATIKKSLASRDAALAAALHAKFERRYTRLDDQDDELRPMRDVVEDLIHGRPYDEDAAFKYGYALQCLCEHFGRGLANEQWSSMRWSWFEQVDAELKKAGVDAKIFGSASHLANRGAPVPLPKIEEFPSIGYLTATEVGGVLTELDKTKKSAIDAEVRQSLDETRTWLDRCARAHLDLVCFYA